MPFCYALGILFSLAFVWLCFAFFVLSAWVHLHFIVLSGILCFFLFFFSCFNGETLEMKVCICSDAAEDVWT